LKSPAKFSRRCCGEDQAKIAEATAELRLSTGGSGLGITLPDVWRKRGWLKNNGVARIEDSRPHDTGGCLFIAGSCSPATRKQNAYFAAQGAHVFELDPQALATGELKGKSVKTTADKKYT
jgi:uncharacterized protein YgbK (DUF1537 family)